MNKTPSCNYCGKSTWTVDGFDEPCCNSCKDNRNEAAYDRQQERLMEGGGGPSLHEQQMAALKIKRGL